MYVRGYLQGSENGRVVTIAVARPLRHHRAIFAFYCCYKNVEIAVGML
jgi:hypothetical protein